MRSLVLGVALLVVGPHRHEVQRGVETVVPNDNRQPGGRLENGILTLRLDARLATWRPDLNVDSTVTVQVFAEIGGAPRIPGPLLRVAAGTEVEVSVRNSLPDSTLIVHGLRASSVGNDTLQIAPGVTRRVRFRAAAAGTYLYWGTTTKSPIDFRPWRDSQLTGAIIVDPAGVRPNANERIFVMTVLDVFPDDTLHNRKKEDIWELAINGRSWPHNERVQYAVGDTVRWRWINGSYLPHPMHLHGFHFRVLAKGDASRDTTFVADDIRLANTELMLSGSTFRMDWVPTRAGNWLMHCHMIPHITPFPERADTTRAHDLHDVDSHATSAMAGLVLGITTKARSRSAATAPTPVRTLRLFAQEAPAVKGKPTVRSYVVERGSAPRADSVEVPSAPIILTRGETTAITVINRLREPTTVHWHGMELESVFDGVSGWSRTRSSIAPLLAPGDSFTVSMTPPRSGTFMYHTHMDEGEQLSSGMYGPLIVLEPGQRYDPTVDLTFIAGNAVVRDSIKIALNGRAEPPLLTLRSGTRYRLRFMNIHSAGAGRVDLRADSLHLTWRPLAKDGADLPEKFKTPRPSWFRLFGVGETYDFEWTPDRPMQASLQVRLEGSVIDQPIRVLP